MSHHDEVIRWRVESMRSPTSQKLANSLSVEGLPYEEIPKRMYARVVAFRKLRRDERERRCRVFLEERWDKISWV
jgi:hypothetical protein